MIIEQLTPIPEEVSLISLGYISQQAHLNLLYCGLTALTGLLITDNLLFYLSLKGNRLSKKLLAKVNTEWVEKVKRNLKENYKKNLFIMALVPKLRFFSPIIAGVSSITWKQFFWVNLFATLLYVSVYIFIGLVFQSQLDRVFRKVQFLQHSIFILVMIAIAVYVTVKMRKIYLKKEADS